MAEKKYSKDDVLKLWNDKAGRQDYFELREVESEAGVKATQVISGGGSLTAQVNAIGADAYKQLAERAGDPFIDPGVNPSDSVGDENKQYFTKDGELAFPTQPEAINGRKDAVEIDHSDSVAPGAHTVDGPAKASGKKNSTDPNQANV